METIKTYTNTMCELEMAKIRLNLLMDRKEQLYCKYFPVTQRIKDDVIKGGEQDKDKFANYLYELHNVDIGTGRSLAQEIDYQRAIIDRDKTALAEMTEILNKTTGIEHELYKYIVIDCITKTQAVKRVAEDYNKEERTIWKYHYSKIKKDLKNLEKVITSTVDVYV